MHNPGLRPLFSDCRAWFSDRRGNVAITFALAIIPVFGAMGVAVDYSLANSARTNMQASLDATGIALQRQSPLSQNQMDTIGGAFFFGNLGYSPLSNVTVTFTPADATISLAATGTYHTGLSSVLKLVGMPTSFPVTARSEVQWGIGKVEVALALDNTGSMGSSGKLTQLKVAAKNLISVLQASAKTAGDAKVAIIPFNTEVNVGTSYVSQTWLGWDDGVTTADNYWDALYGTCSKSGYNTRSACKAYFSCSISGKTSQSSCTSAGTCSIPGNNSKNSCESDHVCSKPQYTSKKSCNNNGGNWLSGVWTPGVWSAATWTPANHNTWTGCVVDRNQSNDVSDTTPTNAIATKFPTTQCQTSVASMMPLNYNWSSLNAKIDQMIADGNTNVTMGLAWGFHALSPTTPLTEGVAYGTANLTKYLIILTDGDNTQNRWTSDQLLIDARTALACASIKAAGIKIYAVRVIDGNAALLKSCATDPATMYFDVQDANQLSAVFTAIASVIANLHLSK